MNLGDPLLKASYQRGRIKPLKYSSEHLIVLDGELEHPIMSKSQSHTFRLIFIFNIEITILNYHN